MECKSNIGARLSSGAVELIETLWNVNLIRSAVSKAHYSELIETLWNVNTDGIIFYAETRPN